jgi:hypothetical protein
MKHPEIPTTEAGKKKCQEILNYLGTLHHQALGQIVYYNVKQIFTILTICLTQKLSQHDEKHVQNCCNMHCDE